MTTTTASPRRNVILGDVRDVPTRFVVLAAVLAAALFLLDRLTPTGVPFPPGYFGFLWPIAAVMSFLIGLLLSMLFAVAPLVALRSVVAGAVLALLPLAPALVDLVRGAGSRWTFSVFAGLVAVAMVGMWRSRAASVVVALVALLPVAALTTGLTSMLMPLGYDITFGYPTVASLLRGLIAFGFYAVLVAVALGFAWWLRSSALVERRETALVARSAEVEGEAVVVGERARLAHDLHDVVAHHVSLIAVRAETAPYTYPDLQPEAKVVLADIAMDARKALDELRGVLGVLRRAEDGGASRAPQPQLANVVDLVESARTTGARVTLEGDLEARVGSATGYVAYRVVQEALTNARKHAPAQPVTVAVHAQGERLLVRVTNDYLSASADRGGAHRGLTGMRERVAALGGRLVAEVQGDYFVVEADLPRGVQ